MSLLATLQFLERRETTDLPAMLSAIALQEANALETEAKTLGEELAEVQGQVEGQITPLVVRIAADGSDPSQRARMESAAQRCEQMRKIGTELQSSVLHEKEMLKGGQEQRQALGKELQELQYRIQAHSTAASDMDRLTFCGALLANHYTTEASKS